MKEAEEEMKRKLEIENTSTNPSTNDNEKFNRKPSVMSTQNVQPYISLLDSLQGNNQEGTDL